ncbi:MAG: hypothetical protein IM504_19755 [Microcystis sp. M038S2]|jgi:hypothetical protein|nr:MULTISPECIES: hypothetical protein [Microcystis]MCA2762410.1 hypothetical protein [Microcystis sp. M151S2]MCU7243391.1 hypothetical protein [Microcystis aeruginosa WS75]MCA2641812.1 hypothetical protein [Microcystis sp. M087S2]MCA2673363.1 hypothetical protein [Microcystis sp. M080S2]MCA2682744.1 hypothetical protein [Microcystis sp. M046S2]
MKLEINFGTCCSSAALLLDSTPKPTKEPLLSIIFDLERTNQLSLLPEKI